MEVISPDNKNKNGRLPVRYVLCAAAVTTLRRQDAGHGLQILFHDALYPGIDIYGTAAYPVRPQHEILFACRGCGRLEKCQYRWHYLIGIL